MRTLVVEDNEVAQRQFRAVLVDAGHRVTAVGSAEEAMELIEGGFRPELLVIDLFLPGENEGEELIGQLRERLPDVVPKNVVVTSVAGKSNEEKLVGFGVPANQILQKGTFGPDDLVRCVQGIGEGKEMRAPEAAPPARAEEAELRTASVYPQRGKPFEQYFADMGVEILEWYEGFVLVRITDDMIQELRGEGFSVDVRDDLSTIRVGGHEIDASKPRIAEDGSVLPHPDYEGTEVVRGSAPYIVQFIGPPKKEWPEQLKEKEAKILLKIPQYAYVVKMNRSVLKKVLKLRFVRWTGEYVPKFRITRTLAARLPGGGRGSRSLPSGEMRPQLDRPKFGRTSPRLSGLYVIAFFFQESLEAAREKVRKLGGSILGDRKGSEQVGPSLVIELPGAADEDLAHKIEGLATLQWVHYVGLYSMPTLYNNVAFQLISPGLSIGVPPFDGEGEMVAIADTGIDTGDLGNMHPGLEGQVQQIWVQSTNTILNAKVYGCMPSGPADRSDGHGTHVAGLIVGTGAGSPGGHCRGVAPGARLFVQALEYYCDWRLDHRIAYYNAQDEQPSPFYLAGLPDDLTELFQEAWNEGARIHSNSWGQEGLFGEYREYCVQVDSYVCEHPELVILFAAGNDGDAGLRTVTPPATAKNCITVGASQDPHNVASFSARGPCNDERIKPDLIALGVDLLSTRSRCQTMYHHRRTTDNWLYRYESGTSMAAPVVAGAAALVRQFIKGELRKRNLNIQDSTAALVKALLINGAERRDFAGVPCSLLYDMVQGWGHLNLTNILNPPGDRRLAWCDVSPRQAYPVSRRVILEGGTVPFKVTLVWTDPPGSPLVGGLVNDLDLVVITPDGRQYNGNVQEPPFERKDQDTDSQNNVEGVMIENPTPGEYEIIVRAKTLIEPPQGFALVWSGHLAEEGLIGLED